MTSKKKSAEGDLLRLYHIAFANTESNPEIKKIMADLGYDSESLAIGKEMYNRTKAVYKVNKSEKEKLAAASDDFTIKQKLYSRGISLHLINLQSPGEGLEDIVLGLMRQQNFMKN